MSVWIFNHETYFSISSSNSLAVTSLPEAKSDKTLLIGAGYCDVCKRICFKYSADTKDGLAKKASYKLARLIASTSGSCAGPAS